MRRLVPLALLALVLLPPAQARPGGLTISVISVGATSNRCALAGGISVLWGTACTPASQLELLDGRAFSILSAAERGENGRGLIGWYQQDEPDGLGLTDLPRLPPSTDSKRVTFLTI